MDTTISSQASLTAVKQFNCPNCGNALSILHPRAQYIACQYCGSELDANSETFQILKALDKPTKHKPYSFIKVGLKAEFDGRIYQVIGRTRWKMRYKEYWSEEGESGYSNETWEYDEWLLMDKYRTYFYIVEDKEGYWRSEEIIPETPVLRPKNLRMRLFKRQGKKIVREYGGAQVAYFEGESNYRIKKGDAIQFTMFKDRSINYSSEWRVDDNRNVKEVEFFKETPISRKRMLEAFSENEAIEELNKRESFWRFVFQTAMISALAMLAMGLFATFGDGQELSDMSQTFQLTELSVSKPQSVGPLNITEPGLYKLFLKTDNLTNGTEVYVFAYVMDEKKLPVNTLEGSFFYYTGYEDGESYTEASDKAELRFKLTEPGSYYVELYRDTAPISSGTLTVSLNKGVRMARYFYFVLIFSLLVAGIARTRYKT